MNPKELTMNPATNPLDMLGPLKHLRESSPTISTVPTLAGKRVAFTGQLQGMSRTDAMDRVRAIGGHPVGCCDPCDVIVEGSPWTPAGYRSTASILAEQNGAAAINEETLVELLTGAK